MSVSDYLLVTVYYAALFAQKQRKHAILQFSASRKAQMDGVREELIRRGLWQ